MSKQELIEKAVIEWQGVFKPECDFVYEYRSSSGYAACVEHLLGDKQCLFTKQEFNATADKMRGKPDWKDAPDWACWIAQSNDGKWHWYPYYVDEPVAASGCFLNKARACCAVASAGKLVGDWRNTLEKRPEQSKTLEADRFGIMPPVNKNEGCSMAAPDRPWFEAGELPKAGECCEYKFQNPDVSWQLVQVNYISEKHAILTILDDGNECHADGFKAADFRPVRTDKEKTIDAAIEVMQPNALTGTMAIWFGRIYDAGLLRLPDQK